MMSMIDDTLTRPENMPSIFKKNRGDVQRRDGVHVLREEINLSLQFHVDVLRHRAISLVGLGVCWRSGHPAEPAT